MKAQMKMGESMMILVIFFFLLVFGLVFYIRISLGSHNTKSLEYADLFAIQTAEKVQFLPELQCTVEGTVDYNCIDTMKLVTFSQMSENNKKIYETMFPRTQIQIVQVFPYKLSWEVYGESHPLNNEHFFPIPVALYNATNDKYTMGYIEVRVFT